ncbi:restriction endonuclease subunit S [Priestia aryabhattai]|uniref:restriction endonuclease subunit S n=1 Tax=Priestia aryabhattai TaxID=412384 RepID=UPI001CCC0C99|nr:restriction endonuclease subunit S [Priestia aryabhattai]MBZ6485088.1 restriction endonuclease subunit S [Priestia aryabhattai]
MSKAIPKIRFKGFTGDWEVRKFKDFITKAGKKNTTGKDYTSYSVSNKLGLVRQDEQFEGSRLDVLDKTSYKLVQPNEFAYNPARINVGSIAFNNLRDTVIVSSLYVVLKMSEKINNEYILQYIKSRKFINEVRRNTEGSVREYLFYENFKNIKFPYTSNYEEQAKIGAFSKQLDDTIALQQQLLDQQQAFKKVMLQKMFPQEGERVPKIRFKEFTGDWEEKNIGELSEIKRGASPRPIQDSKWFDDNSEIGWLRIADVTEQEGRIYHVEQHISKLGQEKTLVLNESHLILSIAATVGKPVINYIKTGIHDGFIVFINPKFNLEFMFQWLEMFRPQWQKYGQPGSQVNINSELVRNQIIFIPSIEEQERIGAFFKDLDDTISLHKQKLEKYQQLKKVLLQRMFV